MRITVGRDFEKATSQNLPKVDFAMLSGFLTSSACQTVEMRGVKAVRSTHASYGDEAVGWVQLKRDNGRCTVKTKICPQQKVRDKDYEVTVVINEKEDVVEEAKCKDCAASEGNCKHASAFVAWLHRRSEEPSPTDVTCYWKKSRLSSVGSKIKCMSIKHIVNEKTSKETAVTTDQLSTDPVPKLPNSFNSREFLQRIISRGLKENSNNHLVQYFRARTGWEKSSMHYLACSYTGDKNNSTEFIQFCKNTYTFEDCASTAKMTEKQSKSSSWFETRYGRITASNLYEAAHCKTQRGALFQKIMGGKTIDTLAMARGRQLESLVIKKVQTKIGEKIYNSGLLLSPRYPCFGASPDGVTGTSVIEIKCPTKSETVRNYISNCCIMPKFKAQVQLQVLFAGKKKAIFVVADPDFENTGHVSIIEENFNEKYISKLLTEAMKFWEESIFPALMQLEQIQE